MINTVTLIFVFPFRSYFSCLQRRKGERIARKPKGFIEERKPASNDVEKCIHRIPVKSNKLYDLKELCSFILR